MFRNGDEVLCLTAWEIMEIPDLWIKTDSGESWREIAETHQHMRSEMWDKWSSLLNVCKSYMTNPNGYRLHRNTVGYQKQRSVVCESVTEMFEIVSTGHHAALSLQTEVDSNTENELEDLFWCCDASMFTGHAKWCTVAETMADILV